MYYEEEWIEGVYCYRTSPDGEWIPLKPQLNAPSVPAMTDHAQRAGKLWKKITEEMLLAKRAGMTNIELARFTDRRAIELIALDRAEAHAQGRRERLEERDALIDALRWCSGNAFDFGECGDARQGWLNVCQPLLDKYNATAKEAGS